VKKKLKALGFVLGGNEIETYSRTYEILTEKQAQAVAKVALQILKEVYNVANDAELQIELSIE
jgi:hypothetical protein